MADTPEPNDEQVEALLNSIMSDSAQDWVQLKVMFDEMQQGGFTERQAIWIIAIGVFAAIGGASEGNL